MFGRKKPKKPHDWTRAKTAREAGRAEKVRWLIERGFNEHTSPKSFYYKHHDKGCPYSLAGLYRVRDTMFRGKAVTGQHNAGSVPALHPGLLLPAIKAIVEQEGTRVIEPSPPLFSIIINAGKWR
ncbi:MAG: hypothetical protein LBK63_06850 [Treponema sp.]|jgi:hypothetical protein|nr:hypothetical protein [Treponema sp.]